jgi:putative transcriptional regulator
MPIIMRLDRVMADRKMSLKELSERVGVANVNLSKMKTGKISAIRFSTLEAICDVLDCQPGDILEYGRECPETISREQHSPAAVPEECADIPGDPHIPPPDIGIGNVALQ